VSVAFQLGFIIAIPVIAFGYLGKWLDQKTGSYPLLTLIGIFSAIVFTSAWIYRKFKNYFNATHSSSPSPASHGGEKREGDNNS
jgi:hypothetical protein